MTALSKTKAQKKALIHAIFNSLDNSNNYEDLRNWYERLKKEYNEDIDLVVELKIDGLSCALSYENGLLKIGATRGNGIIGENITENIKRIKSIPQKLTKPLNIEVRGEVYMKISSFEKLNKENIEQGLKELDIQAADLDGILITHEHIDHIAGNEAQIAAAGTQHGGIDQIFCNAADGPHQTAGQKAPGHCPQIGHRAQVETHDKGCSDEHHQRDDAGDSAKEMGALVINLKQALLFQFVHTEHLLTVIR